MNSLAGAVVSIGVTLMVSRAGPTEQAIAFYRRMRIAGPGWARVRRLTGIDPARFSWKATAICCLASIALLTSLLLGIGYLIFTDWPRFSAMAVVAAGSVALVYRNLPIVLSQGRP